MCEVLFCRYFEVTTIAQSGAARTIVVEVGFGRIGFARHPRPICITYNRRMCGVHETKCTLVLALCCTALHWARIVFPQNVRRCTSHSVYGSTGQTHALGSGEWLAE